jgi:hypothetical protein
MQHKWFRLPIIILLFFVQANAGVWARSEKVTAFINVNLVTMTAETIIPDQTVLVKGTRIIEIGPSNRIDIPQNSNIINGSNTYLMPGLADMHMHYRFEIYKLHGGRVYSTGYNKDMVSHTVPIDALKSGQTYRWRIRIADSDDWVNVQNRSNSEWQVFHLK